MKNNILFELKPNHYGLMHKDKIIYYIELGDNKCGFFAIYRKLLELLYLADVCEMIPVIEYRRNFLYTEDKMVNGSYNAFEYYFMQPCNINVKDIKKSFNVVKAAQIHNDMVSLVLDGNYNVYFAKKLYLNQMAKIQRKYIKLRPETKKYIEEGISNVLGNEAVLGVHIRGTDFKKNFNNHPKYIDEKLFVEEVEKQLLSGKWKKVFLATDDDKILTRFNERFGDKMIFYKDVFRSKSEKSVAFTDNERHNHKYKLGLEVLRDVYTLAACNGLIAGISQVSICARIIKLSTNNNYEFLKIIEHGYNHNCRNFRTDSK